MPTQTREAPPEHDEGSSGGCDDAVVRLPLYILQDSNSGCHLLRLNLVTLQHCDLLSSNQEYFSRCTYYASSIARCCNGEFLAGLLELALVCGIQNPTYSIEVLIKMFSDSKFLTLKIKISKIEMVRTAHVTSYLFTNLAQHTAFCGNRNSSDHAGGQQGVFQRAASSSTTALSIPR